MRFQNESEESTFGTHNLAQLFSKPLRTLPMASLAMYDAPKLVLVTKKNPDGATSVFSYYLVYPRTEV